MGVGIIISVIIIGALATAVIVLAVLYTRERDKDDGGMTGTTGGTRTFISSLIQGCYNADSTFYYVNGNGNPCRLPPRTTDNPLGPSGPTGAELTEMLCPNGISYITTKSNIIGTNSSTDIRPCNAGDVGIPQTISLLIPPGATGTGNYGLTFDSMSRNVFYSKTDDIRCNSLKWIYTGPNGTLKTLGDDLILTGVPDTMVAGLETRLINGMLVDNGMTGPTGSTGPTLEDLQKWIYIPDGVSEGRLCLTNVDNTCLMVGATGADMANTVTAPYPSTGANNLNWNLIPRKGGISGGTNPRCSTS